MSVSPESPAVIVPCEDVLLDWELRVARCADELRQQAAPGDDRAVWCQAEAAVLGPERSG